MKTLLTLTMAAAIMLAGGNVFASDYSQYSTEDLSSKRGTMQNATEQEREAFRYEWQKRVQNMSQEERQEYMGKQGKGMRPGQGRMDNKGYEKWDDDDNDEYRKGNRNDDDSNEYRREKRSGQESGYGSGNGYGKGSGRNQY